MTASAATRRHRLGLLEAVLSGVGFGCMGVLAKGAFNAGFLPGEQLALRFICAASCLWFYLLATRPQGALLPPKAALKCAALGILGYAVFATCYFEALKGLSVSLAVLLLYTYPLLVALGGWLLFKQNPGRRKVISLVPVAIGLGLLVWGDMSIQDPRAVLYGFSAALLYALYILASSRLIADLNPVVSVCYIQTAAATVLTLVHLTDPPRVLFLVQNYPGFIITTAIVCTVGPMLLFLRSLQKITPAEASLMSTAEPITGVLAATVFLGERLGVTQIIGAATIIAALIYMSRPER